MKHMELVEQVAAVVSALQEIDPHGKRAVPASTIYVALGMDMSAHQRLAAALQRAGYARCTASKIQLTAAGLEMGALINGALPKVPAATRPS
jgi:DNA-binding IclR family transcriptional regulator